MESRTQESENLQAAVSREMVRLYKEMFGRGPTRAKTTLTEDMVICTLEDTLTPAERNMAKMGEHQRLRDVRLFFQYATEEDFRGAIEKLTGRRVRAFVSGTDAEQDVSAEIFYLEPRANGEAGTIVAPE
jgi:uncharacterized protein YbcI